jgi:hypothetical protein
VDFVSIKFNENVILGEGFDDPNVVGVGLSIRQKEDCISVWVNNCSTEIKERVEF